MQFLLKEETASERNHTVKSMNHRVLDLDLNAARFCVYGKGPMDVSRSALRSALMFSPTSDAVSSCSPGLNVLMMTPPLSPSPLAHYIDLHLMNF